MPVLGLALNEYDGAPAVPLLSKIGPVMTRLPLTERLLRVVPPVTFNALNVVEPVTVSVPPTSSLPLVTRLLKFLAPVTPSVPPTVSLFTTPKVEIVVGPRLVPPLAVGS